MKLVLANQLILDGWDSNVLDIIEKMLTIPNPKYEEQVNARRSTKGMPRFLLRYKRTSYSSIEIPRGMLPEVISLVRTLPTQCTIIDTRASLPEVALVNSIVPREYQLPVLEKFLQAIRMPYNEQGLLVAPPGAGKTIMALKIAAELKQPTLWLAHTGPLMDQATDYAIFYGFDKKIIGKIKGPKTDIRPITIASVATLYRRDMKEISKNFGTIILDEAHHAPAETFTKVLSLASCKYLIGVTATAFRRDGLDSLIFTTIGDKLAEIDRDSKEIGRMPAGIKLKFTGISHGYINTFTGKEDFGYMLTQIANNEARNKMIALDVIHEVTAGHICMVASARVDQLHNVAKYLETARIKYAIAAPRDMSKKEVDTAIKQVRSGEATVLLATFRLLAEGFDHKPLSRAFFGVPISHKNIGLIQQFLGRIERQAEGKIDAIAYDYIDSDSILSTLANKRVRLYQDMGLKLEWAA